jgi:surfeit locus 1 family protein
MKLRFRPYPGFTVFAAIMFIILCGLGVWQLQRLQWKLNLIATVERNMRARAIPLGDDGGIPVWETYAEYMHVSVHGRFDNSREAYVFTTDGQGDPVYHVLTPFLTPDGHTYLVDRGMVPKDRLSPATRRAGMIEGDTHLTGFWRTPDPPGYFTPAPDPIHRIWYARDVRAIAKADGIRLAAPTLIEADAFPNPGGWPKGGQTVVTFRNEHLSYAITWFGLAAAMLGIWIAYHVSKGRLRLK